MTQDRENRATKPRHLGPGNRGIISSEFFFFFFLFFFLLLLFFFFYSGFPL
jgi:hypothetical protein